jgi:cytochrome c553
MAAVLAAVSLVAGPAAAMTEEERALSKGRTAASALSDTLREKLVASLKDSGPEGAMKVCSYQAQALTREVGEKQGVRVGRTSLKLRNPKNAPDAWERQVLARLQAQAMAGNLSDEVFEPAEAGGKKVFRYAKPMKIVPTCIGCHGIPSEVPAEVQRLLKERYPSDQATGYKMGELRGIVSAVVSLD